MGKKPLVGWVGLCGIGILMTGCGCCNTQGRREGQSFAGGRAEASAGLTNKAWNRPPQNVTAGNTGASTESMSGMSPGTANQFNTAGMTNGTTTMPTNPWAGSQGMGAAGGMPAPNGGGMMSPTAPGTPVSYNGSPLQPSGGMTTGVNNIPGIPSSARFVGSSTHTPDVVQTGGSMNDASAVINAGGSRPANSADGGVRPAMATNIDLSAAGTLPPPPPTGGWNGAGSTSPAVAPPPPAPDALNNPPPPVNSMSTKGLSGSGAAATGPANGLGSYMNSKNP